MLSRPAELAQRDDLDKGVMGHPGAPSGVGGGNPGDAGPAAGDHKEARERYRNALFDREAKAATALLEQVRQYVGRSGKCHVTDFEDLCTIHHAISNLYERVRRFSNMEAMPRVYRNAVKAPPAPAADRPAANDPVQTEAEVRGSDGLEEEDGAHGGSAGSNSLSAPPVAALEAATPSSPPPLFDLVRKVPEITVEDLCRGGAKAPAKSSPSGPSRPNSRTSARKRPQAKVATRKANTPPRPSSSPKTPEPRSAASPSVAVAELFLEVFLELHGKGEGQEMRLEMQICEMPSRSPLRALRVTNKQGSVGTVVLEIHRLRRAELCMALVKDTHDSDRPRLGWDQSEDLSILSPDGQRSSDVLSALRVPVSQLLAACAAGASLEWEADRVRCLVVRGSLLRAGKAVEYIPGQPTVAKSPEPAGNGFQAAQNLRAGDSKEQEVEPPTPAMVSRYVGRLLLRSSMKLRKRAEEKRSGSRTPTGRAGQLHRGI